MLLSLVSGTFNRLRHLQDMIYSFRAATPRGFIAEIIIVDGGSTDDTIEWCEQQRDVRLICHGELRGAIPAFTDGAYHANGKYILLANDDIIFQRGSIMPAIVHLEEQMGCGAVAFADDRPGIGKTGHRVMHMAATMDGHYKTVPYAQVGMFRKWLGDAVGWWGGNDDTFPARTYAGDNYLSSKIWNAGYSVDEVRECKVDDRVVDDNLREINRGENDEAGKADSAAYYAKFPTGPELTSLRIQEQKDTLQLRILYLPIFESGYPHQKQHKRGLRQALAALTFTDRTAIVYEYDYINAPDMETELPYLVETFLPHILMMQLHGHEPVTADMLGKLRATNPKMVVYNWNGDYWPHGLTAPPMLKVLAHVDLQLTVNASVIDTYRDLGIAAAYWQIGFEHPLTEPPKLPATDVVFLGNAYSEERKQLEARLATLDSQYIKVQLWGDGWEHSAGNTLYDFTAGAAIYQSAKISIGDNQFPETVGFVSNRIFQALAAGGALLLHQRVLGLEDLTGLVDGVHYIEWVYFDDLLDKIAYWLDRKRAPKRRRIARAGSEYVRHNHSFDNRVKELFEDLMPLAKRAPSAYIGLVYSGPREDEFGVIGKYICQPGKVMMVKPEDVQTIILRHPQLFRPVGVPDGDPVAKTYEVS